MAHLESRFPILMNKEKLASVDELAPFRDHASQMAALDYIVSVESDVFIPSYSGNMARAVEGHRGFLGHRKTITPDRQGSARKRKGPISGTKGKERLRSEEAFYENPLPDCLCRSEPHDNINSTYSTCRALRHPKPDLADRIRYRNITLIYPHMHID